ncbi:hypothetical protein PybrP1_004196 [[Pythium] brassicae (nom. inval.)]|nr:hypothetical protein PybrP1_004196 [[Pythium] brassicae (nom. inval.)]
MNHDSCSSGDEAEALAVALDACTRQLESLCKELGAAQIGRDDADNELGESRTASESERWDDRDERSPSAVAIATECMRALTALQGIELDANHCGDDIDGLHRVCLADGVVDGAELRVVIPSTQQEDEAASVTSRELLKEMDALASELSSFTALMGQMSSDTEQSTSSPVNSKTETPVRGNDADDCIQAGRVATAKEDPELPTPKPHGSLAFSDTHDSDAQHGPQRAPNLPPPTHSRYQHLLRANPPKPTPVSTACRGKATDRGAGANHQLNARRAQYSLEIKERGAAHQGDQPSGRSSAICTATYLTQFRRERKASNFVKSTGEGAGGSPSEAMEAADGLASGILCGVYVYGNRGLGLAYFTCSTLAQLEERVRRHFRLPAVLNFYREQTVPSTRKRVASKTRTFQRITAFKQIRDGDRLCVTQDSYDDMAILCEWIKQRQLRVYNLQSQQRSRARSPATASVHPKQTARNGEPDSQNSSGTFGSGTVASLWDANGRSMSVKKQLEM